MILLIEDNVDDILFMKRALSHLGIEHDMKVVESGEEAIAYLAGEGDYADRTKHPIPSLIFLDLKMPGKSGFDVLSWIRSHEELQTLLVLILSTSREDRDVDQAYRLGANSFLVKPGTLDGLDQLMTRVQIYWLNNPQLAIARTMREA